MLDHLPNGVRQTAEVVAGGSVILALLEYAPEVSAVFAILWYGVLFFQFVRTEYNSRKARKRRDTDK